VVQLRKRSKSVAASTWQNRRQFPIFPSRRRPRRFPTGPKLQAVKKEDKR
jgi:hypothetical protein